MKTQETLPPKLAPHAWSATKYIVGSVPVDAFIDIGNVDKPKELVPLAADKSIHDRLAAQMPVPQALVLFESPKKNSDPPVIVPDVLQS